VLSCYDFQRPRIREQTSWKPSRKTPKAAVYQNQVICRELNKILILLNSEGQKQAICRRQPTQISFCAVFARQTMDLTTKRPKSGYLPKEAVF